MRLALCALHLLPRHGSTLFLRYALCVSSFTATLFAMRYALCALRFFAAALTNCRTSYALRQSFCFPISNINFQQNIKNYKNFLLLFN
jgi:hypothetical protein